MSKIRHWVGPIVGLIVLVGLTLALAGVFSQVERQSPATSQSEGQRALELTAYPPPPTPISTAPFVPTLTPPPFPTVTPIVPLPSPTVAFPITVTLVPSPGPTPTLAVQPPVAIGARILFVRRGTSPGYFSINPDGTDERPLEPFPPEQAGGVASSLIKASPNGERIVYTVYFGMDLTQGSIWSMRPDGTDKQLLVAATTELFPASPDWSPNGQQIAYIMSPVPGTFGGQQLWVMTADGSRKRLVTDHPAFAIELFGGKASVLEWLQDNHIYFVNHFRELYTVNPANGHLSKLVEGVDPLDVFISPDARKIVDIPGLPPAVLQRVGFRTVSVPPEDVRWSPNSSKVAFSVYEPQLSDAARTTGIWLRDIRTGEEKLLVAGRSAYLLEWSPDGQWLAYMTLEGIYAVNPNTLERHLVVGNPLVISKEQALSFIDWIPVLPQP